MFCCTPRPPARAHYTHADLRRYRTHAGGVREGRMDLEGVAAAWQRKDGVGEDPHRRSSAHCRVGD